ncbi:MAG: hypothetical protein WAL58_04090, partial [Terriglobales bacterium]
MAELVTDLIAIRFLPMRGQGQVAGSTQRILHPFRVNRPKFVSEAQVDVVEEPGAVRAEMLVRIERLHDVLLASLPVLGGRGQAPQVDEEVLHPVLDIFLRSRPVYVPVDPVADVLGKPLMELIEVLRHDEPVVPNVPPVNNGERVGFAIFNRKIGKINSLILNCGGIALHGYFLSKGFELHASKPKRSGRV